MGVATPVLQAPQRVVRIVHPGCFSVVIDTACFLTSILNCSVSELLSNQWQWVGEWLAGRGSVEFFSTNTRFIWSVCLLIVVSLHGKFLVPHKNRRVENNTLYLLPFACDGGWLMMHPYLRSIYRHTSWFISYDCLMWERFLFPCSKNLCAQWVWGMFQWFGTNHHNNIATLLVSEPRYDALLCHGNLHTCHNDLSIPTASHH